MYIVVTPDKIKTLLLACTCMLCSRSPIKGVKRGSVVSLPGRAVYDEAASCRVTEGGPVEGGYRSE